MPEPDHVHPHEPIIGTMIGLACAAPNHRIVVAGSDAFGVYLSLHRRGFSRIATITTCRIRCGQHDVALIVRQHSLQALETLLTGVLPFLKARAIVTMRIGCAERGGRELQSLLVQMGFRVEAGVRCDSGFIVSARRRDCGHLAQAA
jgi:hypothetical protein